MYLREDLIDTQPKVTQIRDCFHLRQLPNIRAEGHQLWRTAQKRVREELPLTQGQGRRPRVPGCDSEGTADRSYHTPEIRGSGREEQPHAQGAVAAWRAERSYSTFKVRRGGGEEIPLVQGKEQRLRFAGAAVKRYPTSKVRETQVRR